MTPVKTAGKQRRCLSYRLQPTGLCLGGTSLRRYVLASCMAVPRSEIVHDKISKSDLNEPEAQCFACWLWLPKHWAMSSALLAQPPPLANLASMQLHKEQQQTIPSIWLRILAESAQSCYAYMVAAEVQANACKGPCSENHSD